MLVDSHAHLECSDYAKDREQVIARARENAVGYILNVAIEPEAVSVSRQLADKYDFIYLSAGVHPHYAAKIDFKEFSALWQHDKLVAIGEIGLDFFRDYAPRAKQEEVFRLCLREARQRKLPVIIHQRAAEQDVLRILAEELDLPAKGVMHCFSGDLTWARQCLERGFLISFAGNITYPKADDLRQAAKEIPLDKLLIETDCPWLAPQAVRGRRCEPAHVKYVAEEIARVKGIRREEVEAAAERNFRSLFNI